MENFNWITVRSALTTVVLSFTLMLSTSCNKPEGENPEIEGVTGPVLNLIEDNMIISIVFDDLVLDGGLRFPIPEYERSFVEVGPDFDSGGTLMTVSVSLQDLFDDKLKMLDPQTLPGGRPLPGVAGGTLPATAFSIQDWGMEDFAFYLGPKLFGSFIPFKLGVPGAILTYRFYVDGKRMGNISLVGEDENGQNSGMFLILDVDQATEDYLRDVAEFYRY
ncbi:MAG: hypothetical protein HOE90_18090 [Bacteriovoracaceae bacterium]|mgnify:CR=1 FL=1|jgi:hypothetical protein|nr:hypothetical protein [Bacteriovoracaceae bacterium]